MGLIGATCYFILLKVMGVPYVATWVVLFFVLSFVPTIGGPLAVAPVLLLMLLEQGIERTIIFTVIFILFNSFLGDIIKPRLMQKGFEIAHRRDLLLAGVLELRARARSASCSRCRSRSRCAA